MMINNFQIVIMIIFELLIVGCSTRNFRALKFQVTYYKTISLNHNYGQTVLDFANRRYRPIWSCTYCEDSLMTLSQFGPEGTYLIGIDELRKDTLLISYWNVQLSRSICVIGNRLLDNENAIDVYRRSDSLFYQCGDSLIVYIVIDWHH